MDLLPASADTGSAAATDAEQHEAGRGEEAGALGAAIVPPDAVATAVETAADTDAAAAEIIEGEGPMGSDSVEDVETGDISAPEPATDTDGTVDAAVPAAPAASDAPPRSWIEGLVAAAAAAEAARLAERAKARGDADRAADEKDDTGEAGAVVDGETGADAEEAGSGTADVAAAAEADTDDSTVDEPDVADIGIFELTEAHAAAPEVEAAEPEAARTEGGQADIGEPELADAEPEHVLDAPVAEALGSVPETGDLPVFEEVSEQTDEATDALDESAATVAPDFGGAHAAAPETGPDVPLAEEAGAEDTAADDAGSQDIPAKDLVTEDAVAEGSVTEDVAGPERSWVDRLIAAAATLRSGQKPAEAEEAASDAPSEATAEETAREAAPERLSGEAETDEGQGGAPDERDALEAEGISENLAPPALEPLNLVDPIAMGVEPDAAVPEWEPVETPDAAERDAGEPVVDMDTVLSGPWTAAAVEEAGTDTPDEAGGPTHAEDAAMAAQEAAGDEAAEVAAEDAAAAAAVADEEPTPEAAREAEVVGALEWEPVDLSEQADAEADTAPEPAERDMIGAAEDGAEADDTDSGQGDEVGDDVDSSIASEGIDDQDESEPALDGAGFGGGVFSEADEIAESEAIDADAAAVAAAAEAEADWEEAGMAAAGVAMSAAGLDRQAPADEDAAPDADGDAAAGDAAGHDVETVIDEAMLRELVAQLVRDELQGTVGERITHNVRRLIRREIARALTLQDFEK